MARTPLLARLCRLVASDNGARREPDAGRRALLRATASLAALGCTQRVVASAPSAQRVGRPAGTIAIIGAGIAGLHAAYRLQQAGVASTIFEASPRSGGRMFTDRTTYPGQVAELGGEFIDSGHITLHTLARELGITLDDRRRAAPASLRELWWLAGRDVPEALLAEQLSRVAPLIRRLVSRIEDDEDSALFQSLDNTSLQAWLDQHVPVSESPELHTALSVAYRGEFGREPVEQSCLNLLYLVGTELGHFDVFGESDERYHARGGSQSFCDALVAKLKTPVELNARLIRASGAGPFVLEFDGPKPKRVMADRVVFTLPFSVLTRVDLSGLELPDEKREMIAELGYGQNSKSMASFSRRVWHEHASSGSINSDLPFQQCWDTSLGQAGTTGILTNFLGGTAAKLGTPPKAQLDGFIDQVDAIVPGTRAALIAGSETQMNWCNFTHSLGSYSCYLVGQWRFWGSEGQRVGNLQFAGEHTSLDFQGFMEGAAESGARVAGEILDDLDIAPSAIHQALLDLERALPGQLEHRTPQLHARRWTRTHYLAALKAHAAPPDPTARGATQRCTT